MLFSMVQNSIIIRNFLWDLSLFFFLWFGYYSIELMVRVIKKVWVKVWFVLFWQMSVISLGIIMVFENKMISSLMIWVMV